MEPTMTDTIDSLSNADLAEATGGRRHHRYGPPPWARYGYGPYSAWGPGPDAWGPPCYGGRCDGPPPWAYRRAAMRGYW